MMKKLLLIVIMLVIMVLSFGLVACEFADNEPDIKQDNITIEGFTIPENGKIIFDKIDNNEEIGKKIIDSIQDFNYNKERYVAIYDISVLVGEKEIQPEGKVKVTIDAPFQGVDEYTVFHVKENLVEELVAQYTNGKVSFETESFSYFVVAEKERASLPEYDFRAYADTLRKGDIYIGDKKADEGNGYYATVTEGTKITLKAVPFDGYKFAGWFEMNDPTGATEQKLVSEKDEETFTVTKDTTLYARFLSYITELTLDAHNAGFAYNDMGELQERTIVEAGSEYYPRPEQVLVYGVKVDDKVYLNKDAYTIETNNYDPNVEGIYTITYTYKEDPSVKAQLIIEVVLPEYDFRAYADDTRMGSILLDGQSVDQGNGYYTTVKKGTKITLKAQSNNEEYQFLGWYNKSKFSEEEGRLISEKTEETFTVENEMFVYARFDFKVSSLYLDVIDAGFTTNDMGDILTTIVIIGEEGPLPEEVDVYACRKSNGDLLAREQYDIDLGGYNNKVAGVYTITYIYKEDTNIKATLVVEVREAPKPKYNFSAKSENYFNGNIKVNDNLVSADRFNSILEENTIIHLVAMPEEGCEFIGWFDYSSDHETPLLISQSTVFDYKITKDTFIIAIIEKNVESIELDVRPGGFSVNEHNQPIATTIDKGVEISPDPEKVKVYECRGDVKKELSRDEYIIDLNGYNYSKASGTFNIIFTHKKYSQFSQTLVVNVIAPKYSFELFNQYDKMGGVYLNGNRIDGGERGGYFELFDEGTNLSLEIRTEPKCEFVGWYYYNEEGEVLISNQLNYTFIINGNMRVFAKFKAPESTGVPLITIDMTGKKKNADDNNVATKIDYYIDHYASSKYQGAVIPKIDNEDNMKYGLGGSKDGYTYIERSPYTSINPTFETNMSMRKGTVECNITFDPNYKMFMMEETGAYKEFTGGNGIYQIDAIYLAKKDKFEAIWNSLPAERQTINEVIIQLENLVMPDYENTGKEVDYTALFTINFSLKYYDFTIGYSYFSKENFELKLSDKKEDGAFGAYEGKKLYAVNMTDYDVIHLNAVANPQNGTHALVINTSDYFTSKNDGSITIEYSGYGASIEGGKVTEYGNEYDAKEVVLMPTARYIDENRTILVNGWYYDYYMVYNVQRLFYHFDFVFDNKTYNCCFYLDLPYEQLNRSAEFESLADSNHKGQYGVEQFNCTPDILSIHKKFFIDECNLPTYIEPAEKN